MKINFNEQLFYIEKFDETVLFGVPMPCNQYYSIEKDSLSELISRLNVYLENYEEMNRSIDLINRNNERTYDEYLRESPKDKSKKDKIKKSGYIYVLVCERTVYYKIGYTCRDDPKKRIEELRTANPSITTLYIFPTDDISEELEWHKAFADKRIEREWFDLEEHDIQAMVYYYEDKQNEK